MNAQTELIPKTTADEAREVLIHLEGEVERRDKALASAREKYSEAVDWAAKQRELVQRLEDEAEDCEVTDEGPMAPEVEAEPEDAEVLELDGVAVTEDGIEYETATGEVVDQVVEIEAPEPVEADAEEEQSGTGIVKVFWPDMSDAVESDVGTFTRYAELIADGLQDGERIEDFNVLDSQKRELGHNEVMPREQWGQSFYVVAKDEAGGGS